MFPHYFFFLCLSVSSLNPISVLFYHRSLYLYLFIGHHHQHYFPILNISLSIFLQSTHYFFFFKHHIIFFSSNITLFIFFQKSYYLFFFSLEWDLRQQRAVLGAQKMSVHKLILTSKVQEKWKLTPKTNFKILFGCQLFVSYVFLLVLFIFH